MDRSRFSKFNLWVISTVMEENDHSSQSAKLGEIVVRALEQFGADEQTLTAALFYNHSVQACTSAPASAGA